MRQITFRMKLGYIHNPTVTVNGEVVDFKKSNGEYVGTYNTELDVVDLEIIRVHEMKAALWWLKSLLFFIFSVFGIFDVRLDRKCICMNYKTTLRLNDVNNVSIAFNRPTVGTKAVECRCDCEAEQISNVYYLDNIAKKRMKIMRIIKALTWVALIVGSVAAAVFAIINY